MPVSDVKTCRVCQRNLPATLEYFALRGDRKGGFRQMCHPCYTIYTCEVGKLRRAGKSSAGLIDQLCAEHAVGEGEMNLPELRDYLRRSNVIADVLGITPHEFDRRNYG